MRPSNSGRQESRKRPGDEPAADQARRGEAGLQTLRRRPATVTRLRLTIFSNVSQYTRIQSGKSRHGQSLSGQEEGCGRLGRTLGQHGAPGGSEAPFLACGYAFVMALMNVSRPPSPAYSAKLVILSPLTPHLTLVSGHTTSLPLAGMTPPPIADRSRSPVWVPSK